MVVAAGEERQVSIPADDVQHVQYGRPQAAQQIPPLPLFTAIEGDGFGVVAHAHQAVAEISLFLILLIVQADQPMADEDAQPGADHGVGEQHANQGDGDGPQHADECQHRHHGVQRDKQEGQRKSGEIAHILADTLVRVVDAGRAAQPVVSAVVEIPFDQVLRHPFTPQQAQPLFRPPVVSTERDGEDEQTDIPPQQSPIGGRVLLRDGGHEISRHIAQEHLHPCDGQYQDEQDGGQPKCFGSALRGEKRLGHDPELPTVCAERRFIAGFFVRRFCR